MSKHTFEYCAAPGTGGDLSLPPMLFKDVNMAFFPLRADILSLRRFCDDHLNLVPPEIAYFQPSGPIVLLGIINYGSMSSEVLDAGWVSQNEVVFSIPLDCYRHEGGRPVLYDRATTSPFIFVDSDTSQVTGRETFGWPKKHVWISREESSTRWGPQQMQRLVTLRSRPLEGGTGAWREGGRPFLEIGRRGPGGLTMFPPDPASALNPWQAWSRLTTSWMRLASDGLDALLRAPGSGYPPQDPQALMQMVFTSLGQMAAPEAALGSSVVNFKQFPRAEHPEHWGAPKAAYQALIQSRMELAQFHRAGMLGETSVLVGDPSGGHRVRLSRRAAGTILDVLGLEVAAAETREDEDVAILEPLFPFWMDIDLRYEKSETVCWRRPDWGHQGQPADLRWNDESGEQPRKVEPREKDRCTYNLARRGATEQITGRLSFPNTTLRVFPIYAPKLEGEHKGEDAFCRSALGDGHCYRRWGNFVYLFAESCEQVADRDTGEISRWAHRKLAFAVPVQRRLSGARGAWQPGEILEWGLVQPIVFVDSDLEAIRCREVNGITAVRASLVSPPSVWMEEFQKKNARSSQLVLDTELPSALGPGQKVERRRLLEIYRGQQPESGREGLPFAQMQTEFEKLFKMAENPVLFFLSKLLEMLKAFTDDPDETMLQAMAEEWSAVKADQLAELCKYVGKVEGMREATDQVAAVRKLAAGLLGRRLTLNQYSLKQFRDAENSTRACYQSRVRQRIVLHPAGQPAPGGAPRLIEQFDEKGGASGESLWLALHSYPVQAITRLLGLEPCWTDDTGDRIVDYFRPMRWSFWIKGTMDVERADEGQQWESLKPPAGDGDSQWPADRIEPDPTMAELLNAGHTDQSPLDPLQLIKMTLDAQAVAVDMGPKTKHASKSAEKPAAAPAGKGVLEAPGFDERPLTLTAMTVDLEEPGRATLKFNDDPGLWLAGKRFSIFGVDVLLLDKGPGETKVDALGVHIPGGATAAAAVGGEGLSLTFDPTEAPKQPGANPADVLITGLESGKAD